MKIQIIRKSILCLATLCMTVMLTVPTAQSTTTHNGRVGTVLSDPGNGQGG